MQLKSQTLINRFDSRTIPGILLAGALLIASAGCSRSSGIPWTHSLSEATAQAGQGRKIIITDLYTDWCGWCKVMDRKTWADPKVISEKEEYVFLRLNAESEPDGIALQKKFNIESFPTVLLLNSDGSEFDRLEGFMPAQEFLERLHETIADPDALGNLLARESRNEQDMDLRLRVARKLFARGAYKEAEPRFDSIARGDPENKAHVADTALFFLALCQASQDETEASLATIEHLRKSFASSKLIPDAQLLSSEILVRTGRHDQAKAQIEGFLKAYPNHRLASRARHLLEENNLQ